MVVFPNSKINLGLKVLAQRPDGYHDISSVFYPIPYSDVLEVVISENSKDDFFYSGKSIPGNPENNLCAKAVKYLRSQFEFPAISIYLHKNISMGAGLGGGSSDASYLLRLINDQFDLAMSIPEMEKAALLLGSDCPFFIENKPRIVSGRGEVFEPCALDLSGMSMVLVTSDIHISTADAYGNIQRKSTAESPGNIIANMPVSEWRDSLHNDFEGYAFEQFPILKQTKTDLYDLGAVYASMTGSGSAIYGLFKTPPEAKGIAALSKDAKVFLL